MLGFSRGQIYLESVVYEPRFVMELMLAMTLVSLFVVLLLPCCFAYSPSMRPYRLFLVSPPYFSPLFCFAVSVLSLRLDLVILFLPCHGFRGVGAECGGMKGIVLRHPSSRIDVRKSILILDASGICAYAKD